MKGGDPVTETMDFRQIALERYQSRIQEYEDLVRKMAALKKEILHLRKWLETIGVLEPVSRKRKKK